MTKYANRAQLVDKRNFGEIRENPRVRFDEYPYKGRLGIKLYSVLSWDAHIIGSGGSIELSAYGQLWHRVNKWRLARLAKQIRTRTINPEQRPIGND